MLKNMAASQHSQRNAPSRWGNYLSTWRFWERGGQHESSMQDQQGQFRVSSVDPEHEPAIHRNMSSASVKVDLTSEMGRGAFAMVYKGCLIDRKEECALKVFNDKVRSNDVVEEFKRMRDLKHPNIVRVFGMIPDYEVKGRNALAIVMELCDMSLDQYIKERFKKGISKKVNLLQILHDIASAMVYLHSRDMVHGDLRSPNVLVIDLGDHILAKITDFGMTGCLNEAYELTTTIFADAKYLPPEVFVNSSMTDSKKNWVKLSRKVDVFCFGPIAIELGCGEFPEPTAKSETRKKTIVKTFSEIQRREKHIKKVRRAHSECIELIVQQCMQDRPEHRTSFSEILLTVEGLQKQCKKRPDSEWIEEKQHEIEDLRAQMERDQEAMKDYKHCTNHKWQEMESEKDVLKRNAEELKRDLSTKEQVVNELTEKVRQQSKELESVGFQNITLESQVRDLEAVNIKVKKQVNDERLKKDEELKELKESNKRKISQERDENRVACDAMNAEIKELQREIKEKDSQMETLSHRKDMLISEMETQCQDLRSKNEQEQMHLREQVSKLERDVEEANSALDERKRAVETLKNQLEEGTDIAAVHQQYEEEKRRLEESFEDREKRMQHDIDKMKLEKNRQTDEANRLQKVHDLLVKERDQLQTERDNLKTGRDDLKTERDDLKTEQDDLKSKQDDLKTKQDDLKAERDDLKTKRDDLQAKLDDLKSKQDDLKTERDDLKTERDDLQAELDDLKSKQDDLKTERDDLKTERDDLQAELDDLKSKQYDLKTERDDLKTERDDLKTERDDLKTERDDLKTERDDLKTERDDLKTERDDLKLERDDLETNRNKICIEKEQLESANREIISTMTAEKGQLEDEIEKARDLIVEWLKDDESENDVDGESPLKDLLLGVQEAHHMEVTRLKDEGETSLQVAADEYKENWQNSSKEHQIKMAKKEEEIQQLKNLLEEKLVHVQKLSADLRENKKESQSMQAYIHSLHRNKTAEKKGCVGEEAQEEEDCGKRAIVQEELEQQKDKLAKLQIKLNDLTTVLQTTQNSLDDKTKECEREKQFALEQQKKLKIQEEENKCLQKQWSKTKADFQTQRDCLSSSVSKIRRKFDCMCNDTATTLTGHIEFVTCRLGKLDLKLKEEHMTMHEKMKASKSMIAVNKDLKATCEEYENINRLLHRKLTKAKFTEGELREAWKEECIALKETLSQHEEELDLLNKISQEKDENIDSLVKSIHEKDELFDETKAKLSIATAHFEHLVQDNEMLRGTVEACWRRIRELDDEQESQASQITTLEEALKEEHSELLDCQEKCRLSEEEWNNKLAEKKKEIATLETELSLIKDKVHDLQSQLAAEEVVHNVLLKCVKNEYKLKFKDLQTQLTDSKNQCATYCEMLSHKDHELQDVHEDLAAARSKTECDEYECATLQEEVSRKAHELQDVHEELIAVKSSNEKIKEERDQYEDAQLDLQKKVQELEQRNRRLEETVCRDESHLTLVRDQGRLKAQLTILEDAHRKVLAEKHQLQISHECLAKALEQLTPQLEEEKKEFERKQRKQEKYFRDKRDKLRLGEAELKEGFQRVEVEKTKFQEQKKLFEAFKELPETCKKEWREVKEECRQAADRQNEVLTAMSEKYEKHMQLLLSEYKKEWREVQDGYRQAADEHIQDLAKQQKEFFQCMSEQCEKHMQLLPTEYKKEWREVHEDCKQAANKQIQELAKHKKDFFHHLNTMSEQYDKHMHLVKSEAHPVPKFLNFNHEAMREFMITYILFLRQPKWACDNVDTGPFAPEKQLSQLCEVGSFKCISTGSLFPKNYSTFDSAIHSECPSAVKKLAECIRTHHTIDKSVHSSLVTEAGSACSFTFLQSADKVYLCHLLITNVPNMIAPDKKELEPDTLHCLVQMALHDNFGEEMQKAANSGNISKGVIYNPFWHGQEPPEWSRKIPWESLPEKAKPVAGQLQLEAARKLDKLLKCWMDRIPTG